MKVRCIRADKSANISGGENQLEYLKIYNVIEESNFLYKIDLGDGKVEVFSKNRFEIVGD